jgi:hypothetical protein
MNLGDEAGKMNWQRIKYSFPSLIMAELAIYVTPLKGFIPYSEILYLIPVISMLGNRKPFSFPLFLFLTLLNLTPHLYGSEVVKGIVNLADYAGIGYVYEIYQLFGLYRGIESALLPVVLLFSISEVSWWAAKEAAEIGEEAKSAGTDRIFSVRIAYSFLMGVVALTLAYRIPELASSIGFGYPPLVLGLLGVAALFMAVILLR